MRPASFATSLHIIAIPAALTVVHPAIIVRTRSLRLLDELRVHYHGRLQHHLESVSLSKDGLVRVEKRGGETESGLSGKGMRRLWWKQVG